eukprot:3310912-Pyramimonas_sp.AAC.1
MAVASLPCLWCTYPAAPGAHRYSVTFLFYLWDGARSARVKGVATSARPFTFLQPLCPTV